MKLSWDNRFLGGLALIALSFLMLIVFERIEFLLLSFPTFILGLDFLLESNDKDMKELPALSVGSLLYLIFYIVIFHVPKFWLAIRTISFSFSELIGTLKGTPIELGPSLSGLWILLSLLIFLSSFYIMSTKTSGDLKLFVVSSAIIILLFVALFSMNFLPLFKGIEVINLLYVKYIILTLVFLFFVNKYDLETIPLGQINLNRNQIFIVAFLFVVIIFITIFPYANYDKKSKILFYENESVMGFEPPRFPEENEVFGPYQEMSYGGLKQYLQTRGHEVDSFKGQGLAEKLANTDILIMVNLNRSIGQENLKLIWEYVRNGGGLLVLGEHTNMFVTLEEFEHDRHYLNEVLNPTGIRIGNDTADFFDDHWEYAVVSYPHFITDEISDLTTSSVGASLALSGDARPLMIGKYSFSDKPNPSAPGFLGNRSYDDGEELGDIILAASDTYGAGNVLVIGDTSYFYDTSISRNHRLIDNSIAWLMSRESQILHMLALISIFIVLCLILISLLGRFDFPELTIIFIAFLTLSVAMALIASGFLNYQLIKDHPFEEKSRIAWIDQAHLNQYDSNGYSSSSIDGLIINLYRNNYTPITKDNGDFSDLSRGNMFIIISPTSSYGQGQISYIKEFVEKGGLLIISSGYKNKIFLDPILKLFDIDINETPLGSVPWIVETHDQPGGIVSPEDLEKYWHKPKFMEVHPVFAKGDFKPITWLKYQGKQNNFIISKQYGEGVVVLIGDSRFLLNENFERLSTGMDMREQYQMQWLGNIELFSDIIRKYEMGIL